VECPLIEGDVEVTKELDIVAETPHLLLCGNPIEKAYVAPIPRRWFVRFESRFA
jgi:hypothetical protein